MTSYPWGNRRPAVDDLSVMRHIATFCGSCNCGCPELFVDETAEAEKRIVITDDFGQRIQMSVGQLADLIDDVRRGVLDEVVASTAS
ncbi:hypothetical protein [Pseudonocardia sp. N23]|uniref:hypothetical protein n=1 Tax=Pseudonocardia sp. N23 TaxID=1987376 RepID=UPI00278BC8DB|nr:hypothetical protein [Pseudonocardia sp. N23]